jgi:hypothetical protein
MSKPARWCALRSSLRFVDGCRDRANFRDFFVLVIVEARVNEGNKSKNRENQPYCHNEAFHGADTNIERTSAEREIFRHTPSPDWQRGRVDF